MRWIFRLLHWFFFWRAVSRGPGHFARYEVRRQARRAVYRGMRL
jgi:hypothetical protein